MAVDYMLVGGVVSMHNLLLDLGMGAGRCPRTYAEWLDKMAVQILATS